MTLADATAVATAVRAVLTARKSWRGTARELLHALAAADGMLALPGNARAHLRSVALLLRESGIEVSFVRSGHAGTRIICLADARLGVTPPLPVDSSRSSDSRLLTQPVSGTPDTLAQAADANGLIADANSTSGVLTQASDALADTTAPTATDTLTQTAAPDEASASAEALTQVAPTPSLTFEQHIVRWLDEHPEPSEPGRCAYCGEMETRGRPVVPFETAPSTHAWLHSGCWRAWRGQRRFRALMAVGGGKLPG